MNSVMVFRSRTGGAPSVRVSTGLHPTTTALGLDTGTQEMVSTAASASTTLISSDWTAAARRLGGHTEGVRRAMFRLALPVDRIAATPAQHRPDQPPTNGRAADPEPIPAPQSPAFRAEKIELTIESLQNYDLAQPIPVVVESLGERFFVAEIPDLDISMSGTSVSDTLILLKAHIATVYDGLRSKKNLDSERTRQLKLLETYIGKAKRSWF